MSRVLTIACSVPLLFATGCVLVYGSWWSPTGASAESSASLGEHLRSEGKTEEAVDAFEKHMEHRLAAKRRDESENPYFYYLLIGDTYRDVGRIDEARAAYLKAKDNGVEPEYIVDRFKLVAKWYEEKTNFPEALRTLEQLRALDPDSVDAEIDRIHKRMIESLDGATR